MWYIHNEIYYSAFKKEGKSDIWDNVNRIGGHYNNRNKPEKERLKSIWHHLYVESKKERERERERMSNS